MRWRRFHATLCIAISRIPQRAETLNQRSHLLFKQYKFFLLRIELFAQVGYILFLMPHDHL